MDILKKRRLLCGAATVVYAAFLLVFYWKYVPLIAAYQAALIPLLLIVTIGAAIDVRRGLLAFIFLFPLINNLPYFFKLYEPLPMAPSALVLFLFFFLGWLLHRTFAAPDPVHEGEKPNEPIFTPLRLFAGLVAVSGLITFWRYTNFFPLWRPRIYELIANVKGVSAGGAIMSVVFYSLTYLTGIAFFAILVRAVRTEAFVQKALSALGAGALFSLGFGLVQRFAAPTLGNNPHSIKLELINATFKDALSFGAFLSMIIPLFAGLLPALKGRPRLRTSLMIIAAGYLLFFAGSKSALIAVLTALFVLAMFAIPAFLKSRRVSAKIIIPVGLAGLVLIGSAVFLLVPEKSPFGPVSNSVTLNRMSHIGQALKKRTSKHWMLASRMIRDFPLSGVGVGAYIIEMANDAKTNRIKIDVPESAENLPLQVGSELGIPGLLLYLWILWELGKRAVASYRAAPYASFSRALIAAAAAGLFAFWLDSQSHSYIGSYEIQYLFWFLAALIFAVAAPRRSPGKPDSFLSRLSRFAVPVLVILGGVSLLWNSVHSLSLNRQSQKHHLRQEFGLGPFEKDSDGRRFRWSGRYAGIPRQIDGPSISVWLLASHPDIGQRPVQVRIFLAADLAKKPRLLRKITLTENRWKKFELPVPADIRGLALLLFEADRTWNPREMDVSADTRDLGLAIGRIETSGREDQKRKGNAAKPGKAPPQEKKE